VTGEIGEVPDAERLTQARAKAMRRAGQVTDLQRLAAAGDRQAAQAFARWSADHGDVEALSRLATAGDEQARWVWSDLLVSRRRPAEALDVLRPLVAAHPAARRRAARRLAGLGRFREAMTELAEAPAWHTDADAAAGWLRAKRTMHGWTPDPDQVAALRELAGAGDGGAASELSWLALAVLRQRPREAADLLGVVGVPEWPGERLVQRARGWESREVRAQFVDRLSAVSDVATAASIRQLVARLRLLDAPRDTGLMPRDRPDGRITGLAWAPGEAPRALAVTLDPKAVEVWAGGVVRRRFTPESWVMAPRFWAGGRLLAAAGSIAQVWVVDTGESTAVLPAMGSQVAFSPEGDLIAGASVHRTDGGGHLADLGPLLAVEFRRDGRHVALATNLAQDAQYLRLVEAATGRVVRELASEHRRDAFCSVAFDDGATLVAVERRGRIRVRTLPEGQLVAEVRADGWRQLALDPAGTRLAVTFGDAGVKVWNLTTGRIEAIERPAVDLAFGPDGGALTTASPLDGTVTVHILDPAAQPGPGG